MRRILTALVAVAALAGLAAGTASADSSHVIVTPIPSGQKCQTVQTHGVLGQYGAWGYFIDGCTARATCPSYMSVCTASSHTYINTFMHRGDKVTQNARLRVFSAGGVNIWFRDKSCNGTDTCANDDLVYINGGQTATSQCNGVIEKRGLLNEGVNVCMVTVVPLY